MRDAGLPGDVIAKLAGHPTRVFAASEAWMRHLQGLGLTELRVAPDPVRTASEAALWGAIVDQGLLRQAVVVSDDAGQVRVGEHALGWAPAERPRA